MFYPAATYLKETGWKSWQVRQQKIHGGVVWFVHANGAEEPAMVGKCYFDAARISAAKDECANLKRLEPWSETLRIPRLLFEYEGEAQFLSLQTAAAGRPLGDHLSVSDDREIGRQLEIVVPWLERFQTMVAIDGSMAASLCEVLESVPGVPEPVLRSGRDALSLFEGIPAVAVHGDFWGRNILAGSGSPAVIDWATLHSGGALEDLFTFCSAAVYKHGPSPERSSEALWEVFFGTSAIAVRTRESAVHVLRTHGSGGPHLLKPHFFLFLLSRIRRIEFTDNAAWRVFLQRYASAGVPSPWYIDE